MLSALAATAADEETEIFDRLLAMLEVVSLRRALAEHAAGRRAELEAAAASRRAFAETLLKKQAALRAQHTRDRETPAQRARRYGATAWRWSLAARAAAARGRAWWWALWCFHLSDERRQREAEGAQHADKWSGVPMAQVEAARTSRYDRHRMALEELECSDFSSDDEAAEAVERAAHAADAEPDWMRVRREADAAREALALTGIRGAGAVEAERRRVLANQERGRAAERQKAAVLATAAVAKAKRAKEAGKGDGKGMQQWQCDECMQWNSVKRPNCLKCGAHRRHKHSGYHSGTFEGNHHAGEGVVYSAGHFEHGNHHVDD